jgi:hypothetical protein
MRKRAWAALAVRALLLIQADQDDRHSDTPKPETLPQSKQRTRRRRARGRPRGALGKQGSVSALLKTLGQMSPEERQVQGPVINGCAKL